MALSDADRSILIESNAKELQKTLSSMASAASRGAVTDFDRWGHTTIGAFKARRLSGAGGLKVRSGDLRRSFRWAMRGSQLNDIMGRFFTRSKYAAIHEFGGDVRPVRRKYLAVPIPGGPALTPAGVSRYPFSLYSTLPQDYDFFVIKSKKGNLLLMGRAPGEKEATPWYVLRKKVHIEPTMRFRVSIEDAVRKLKRRLVARYKSVVERGNVN